MQSSTGMPSAGSDSCSSSSVAASSTATTTSTAAYAADAAVPADPAPTAKSQQQQPPSSPTNVIKRYSNGSMHLSAPVFQSPLRQHRRTPSQHREVKETLNAVSEFADNELDGLAHHKINQYTIKSMIGKGSYGSVHIATDQYGQEYAIKEVSKTRLRKRARSNIMRQGPRFPSAGGAAALGFSPAARFDSQSKAEAKDALFLIREEVAIMKKLNHPNLVQLIEVLDDPDEDSLYMVLEMCKKGVIMDVGLGKTAKPYDEEACRCWFRDLILGIEYLHAQNVVHRDIKPDNLLITDDDVLKIGDFGVSEIFEKPDEMRTTKTAGSPAFLPPELCVAHHGEVSGPACDIWSMGVTLYCLRYGRIPFEHATLFDIYEAINNADVTYPEHETPTFVDLMHRILEKDPQKRITMPELRDHPWVTKDGTDPLLSAEENCAEPIGPPNALEVNHAFTRNMSHLLCVMKAIQKFKGLLSSRRFSVLGATGLTFMLPNFSDLAANNTTSDAEVERLVEERRENKRKASFQVEKLLSRVAEDIAAEGPDSHVQVPNASSGGLAESQMPYFGIGMGGVDGFTPNGHQQTSHGFVSESPSATDFDVYDRAFQSEVDRILSQHNQSTVYTNKVLERRRSSADGGGGGGGGGGPPSQGNTAGNNVGSSSSGTPNPSAGGTLTGSVKNLTLADVVKRAMKESKS